MTFRMITCLAAIGAISIPVHAQLHVGDIVLETSGPPEQIRTGGTDGVSFATARVFSARFGDSGFTNRTTNPGFNAVPNQFPTGSIAGVSITRALRKWDGSDLCTIPSETVTFTKLGVTATSPPADPAPENRPSVAIGISDAFDGLLHEHGAFALTPPASNGVYALELLVWVGSPATLAPAPSDPFWIVFNQNTSSQEVSACVDFLLANGASHIGGVISPCPCLADFNDSGGVGVQDIFDFLNAWFLGLATTDVDGVAGITVQDIFAFLNSWFSGCP